MNNNPVPFNRTILELKLSITAIKSYIIFTFQPNHTGIEMPDRHFLDCKLNSFNRTILELKLVSYSIYFTGYA